MNDLTLIREFRDVYGRNMIIYLRIKIIIYKMSNINYIFSLKKVQQYNISRPGCP